MWSRGAISCRRSSPKFIVRALCLWFRFANAATFSPFGPAQAETQGPSTHSFQRLDPRFRGDERRMPLRPVITYSVVKEPVFSCQIARCGWRELRIGKRTSAPVSALGQGIALIPSCSSSSPPSCRGGWRADKAHGLDRQAGGGTACGRALGVKRHAPHLAARQRGIFGLRLSQRSGHARSCMSLEG
jgi:hypothetical protein